ncbi:hypothetical protein ACU8KH_02946 [Lachancea thermotolerans]
MDLLEVYLSFEPSYKSFSNHVRGNTTIKKNSEFVSVPMKPLP